MKNGKRSILATIFIITAVVLVSGYIIYANWSFSSIDKQIICKNLEIKFLDKEKIKLISQTDIAEILVRENLNPIGILYGKIYTEKIEKAILKNPMVKSVECYKTPSGIIYLEVKQRIPRFIVLGSQNQYVDDDKMFFPVSLNNAVDVPVVTGLVTKKIIDNNLFDFVNYIADDSFWDAQIEQIHIRPDQKVELITRVGDAVILMGSLDNYEKKLTKLFRLYHQVFNNIGWNKYETINLQFKEQIVCKHRKNKSTNINPWVNKTDSLTVKEM